jgi:outer membrane lipoprotein SlyB
MMKNIATKFAVTAFAVAALASPVFAGEESRDNATMNQVPVVEQGTLKALQEIPGALNQLSETELARVEGGFHGATAAAFFGAAFLLGLQNDFFAAANASVAGALIGTQVMTHN